MGRRAGTRGGSEAVPRRVGGRELGHDVARERVVGGDRAAVRGRQDELAAAPLRGGRHRHLVSAPPLLCLARDMALAGRRNVMWSGQMEQV